MPVGVLVLRVRRRADDDAHDRASRGDLRAALPVKRRRKPKPRPASLLDVARSGARSARAAAVCGGRGSRARLRHRASRALPGSVQGDQPRRRAGGMAPRAEAARPARLRRRARSEELFDKEASGMLSRSERALLRAHDSWCVVCRCEWRLRADFSVLLGGARDGIARPRRSTQRRRDSRAGRSVVAGLPGVKYVWKCVHVESVASLMGFRRVCRAPGRGLVVLLGAIANDEKPERCAPVVRVL